MKKVVILGSGFAGLHIFMNMRGGRSYFNKGHMPPDWALKLTDKLTEIF